MSIMICDICGKMLTTEERQTMNDSCIRCDEEANQVDDEQFIASEWEPDDDS